MARFGMANRGWVEMLFVSFYLDVHLIKFGLVHYAGNHNPYHIARELGAFTYIFKIESEAVSVGY
jgi:hypothetical protein